MNCPYCGAEILLKPSAIVYGRDYGLIYICSSYPSCDAFVGVHQGTKRAKGTLANAELRLLRKQCHAAFDAFWRKKNWGRGKAYKWLSKTMGISRTEAHIGMFREANCILLLKVLGGAKDETPKH